MCQWWEKILFRIYKWSTCWINSFISYSETVFLNVKARVFEFYVTSNVKKMCKHKSMVGVVRCCLRMFWVVMGIVEVIFDFHEVDKFNETVNFSTSGGRYVYQFSGGGQDCRRIFAVDENDRILRKTSRETFLLLLYIVNVGAAVHVHVRMINSNNHLTISVLWKLIRTLNNIFKWTGHHISKWLLN